MSTVTSIALADAFPSLRFIVQFFDPLGFTPGMDPCTRMESSIPPGHAQRIAVQTRLRGAPQSVLDANVYIIHLPNPSLAASAEAAIKSARLELKLHLDVHKSNRGANLIIVARVTPEPGMTNARVEAVARSEDLLMLQLSLIHI